jgi:hypothetical protein
MSERVSTPIPKLPDGTNDVASVKQQFMKSEFIDWTRFCEHNGWDNHITRPQFPVRTWQEEKKNKFAVEQSDTILSMMHERKFNWTKDILKTLDRYPKMIDMGASIMEAKMNEIAAKYKDYVEWLKDPKKVWVEKKKGEKTIIVRAVHPFEKISMSDISFLMRALKELTDSKMKALMLDKWAPKKLDLSPEELDPKAAEENKKPGITIEGKSDLTFEDMQKWFDSYIDKPDEFPTDIDPQLSQAKTVVEPKNVSPGVMMLDDKGREI